MMVAVDDDADTIIFKDFQEDGTKWESPLSQ